MKAFLVVSVALGTLAAAAVLGGVNPAADDAEAVQRPMVLAAASDPVGNVAVNSATPFSFPIRSFSLEMTNATDPGTGTGGGSGAAKLGGFTALKAFDANTVRLQKLLLTGVHVERVVVTLEAGGSYTLDDVIVGKVASSGAGLAVPTDRVTFLFNRIRVVKGTAAACWNRSLNSAC